MTTPQEYRKFADECLRWATEAETDEFKDAFIQMARDWTLVAMRLEGVLAPRNSEDQAEAITGSNVQGGFHGHLSADCQRHLWARRN